MKEYKHYEDLAKLELERAHGRSTVDLVTQLKASLHTVAQSLIMLDLINALAEKEAKIVESVTVEEEVVKTVKSPVARGVKK